MKISRLMAKFIAWTTVHQIADNTLDRCQDFADKIFVFCKSEYDIEEWFFLSLLPKNVLIHRISTHELCKNPMINDTDLSNPDLVKIVMLDTTSLINDCHLLATRLNRLYCQKIELIPLLLCNRYVEILGGNYSLESGPALLLENPAPEPVTGQRLHTFLRRNLDRYMPHDHDWFPRLLSNMAANQGASFFQTLQQVNGSLSSQVLAEWLELKSQLNSLRVERLPNSLPKTSDLLFAPLWLLLSFSAALVWWPIQQLLPRLPRRFRVLSIPIIAVILIALIATMMQLLLPVQTIIFWPLLAVTGCKHRAWIKQRLTNQRGWLLSKKERQQFRVLQEKILYLAPSRSSFLNGSYKDFEEASIL